MKNPKNEISCVNPDDYAQRFINFMGREVFVNENQKRLKDKAFDDMYRIFNDNYHLYYLCKYCGRTYNDEEDERFTKVREDGV